MPFSIKLQGNYATISLTGHITLAEVTEVARILDDCTTDTGATPHRLVDIAAVQNLAVGFSEMHAFGQMRRTTTLRNKVKTAVVAGSTVQFGIARMFELMNAQPQTEIEVFRDPAAALEWILGRREPESERVT